MSDSQIGGALPAQMPTTKVGKTDKAIARSTVKKAVAALKTTQDPQLKAELSNVVASLHTYLAQDSKADKKGQAPKVSPKAVTEPKPRKK